MKKGMKSRPIWMAVDITSEELPLAIGNTAKELAQYLNTTAHNITVKHRRKDTGLRVGYRVVKILTEGGEDYESRPI